MSDETRILAVDDETRGVELLQRALRKLGRVDGAFSGEEAWERFQEFDYHLVVSDQRMPGMSGVELLTQVAAANEHTGRIVLTGYSDMESTVDAINCGRVHAYLSKPCDPMDLRLTVQGVLERISLGRENVRLVTDLTHKNAALEAALASLEEAQERALASEKLAAIARLSAMIVHDLRGPITALRSAAGALERDVEELSREELAELGRDVTGETERMQRMCDELQSSAQAGGDGGRYQDADLDGLVGAALSTFGEEASQRGVRLELELASEATLHADADRLRRALLNLCFNALEAMPDGGTLRVETALDGDTARLSVIDSGRGLPEAIGDRIFEAFVSEGKARGTGLGLAVVKKVVEDHAGRIEVGKPEGGGAAFHLYLPVAPGRS